jgi:hypothetical protein
MHAAASPWGPVLHVPLNWRPSLNVTEQDAPSWIPLHAWIASCGGPRHPLPDS